MIYKNIGNFTKSFYGIDIKPNEIKEFPGYVSSQNIIEASIQELSDFENKPRRGRKPNNTKSPLINTEVTSTDKDIVNVDKPKEKVTNGTNNN